MELMGILAMVDSKKDETVSKINQLQVELDSMKGALQKIQWVKEDLEMEIYRLKALKEAV